MTPYLVVGLEIAPQSFRRLMEALGPERWDVRLHADRFTPREVVAHLADWEPIFRDRMQDALTEPGKRVLAFDEGERAIERDYAGWDVHEALNQFAGERAETAAFLSRLARDRWDFSYSHPEIGQMTIAATAAMLLGHDAYHVEQLTEYLASR